MEYAYEAEYHKIEEKNWWFISRRDMILQLIKKICSNKNVNILEIGCSGGPLIKFLHQKKFLNISGIDISQNAIKLCKKRGLKNVKVMDGAKTTFNDDKFDLIIASDTLEHIKNDNSALLEWYRILKPNGKLIIFVPAFNFLWSSHDEINHHFRRYSQSELRKKIKQTKFRIISTSYWNFCIFLPVMELRLIQRLIDNKKSRYHVGKTTPFGIKTLIYKLNPFINRFLIYLLAVENYFLKFSNFPFGVSIYLVCEK